MWDFLRGATAWVSAHNLSATGWAAVAAMFSALSSFLIMRVQRSNFLESVRPELVPVGWYRISPSDDTQPTTIGFQGLRNVGRGTALHIRLHAHEQVGDFPTAVMGSVTVPLLAAAEAVTVDGDILVWFKNVPGEGTKSLSVTVHSSCVDSRGNLYETQNNLFILGAGSLADEITNGVVLHCVPTMTPAWRFRLRGRWIRFRLRLQQTPVLGRLMHRKP